MTNGETENKNEDGERNEGEGNDTTSDRVEKKDAPATIAAHDTVVRIRVPVAAAAFVDDVVGHGKKHQVRV